MKKYCKLLIVLLVVFLVTGCGKKYDRKDISSYVKNEIGIKKIKVSNTAVSSTGKDGYEDSIWTVYDVKNDITFHVRNNRYYSMEWSTNSLDNDYSTAIYNKYNNKIKGISNITVAKDEGSSGSLETNGLDVVKLQCNFTNKNSLSKCINSGLIIQNYFSAIYKNFKLSLELNNDKTVGNLENSSPSQKISTGILNEEKAKDLLDEYLEYGLKYQESSIISEFSTTEIENYFKKEDTSVVYKLDDNNRIVRKYTDIVAPYGQISMQCMYQLLKDEGFSVIGTQEDFTVYSKTGDKYEFSTGFNDYTVSSDYDDCYYKKNGQIERLRSKSMSFHVMDINKLFDINVKSVANKFYDRYFDSTGQFKEDK